MERVLERIFFAGRWLLVPIYLGLLASLLVFAIKALQEVVHLFAEVATLSESEVLLGVLALMDIALVANLLVMVVLSSYESFVSRIDLEDESDRPSWLGKLDAGTVKVKLAASIVAISGIHLLKAFMNIDQFGSEKLMWLVIIHLTFVLSALLLALIDRIAFSGHRGH